MVLSPLVKKVKDAAKNIAQLFFVVLGIVVLGLVAYANELSLWPCLDL